MARTKKYQPTEFMLPTSHYDKERADHAVNFIQSLKHTKGVWAGQPFLLFDWQEKIIRDLFGTIKANGYRQFNTAFVEICKKAVPQLQELEPGHQVACHLYQSIEEESK